jgi:hypothetical protein
VIARATNKRTWVGICVFENPGASIRHPPIRQNSTNAPIAALGRERCVGRRHRPRDERGHAIVPSDFTSKPRAISSCDKTARVGNMRSMIMRT